ncbi:MAG TPA: hypothetical protein VEI46_09140, partial [Thermodesulfovibrionales bacterium]|nr:hypothetical protein [Thermodesulfovibrionales bacterium]
MKKLCLIVSLSMVVILAFAAFTWASESSVFDNVEGILIRACTNEYQVSAPPYSAFLDVRDSTGALMPVGTFTVYDISTGLPVLFPVTQNPFLVYSDLTNPTVSLTLDSDSGAAYLFRTNSGVDVTKYAITNLANGH